jgi:hypothetical protein
LIEGVPVPIGGHGVVFPTVGRGVDGLVSGFVARGVNVIRGAIGFGARATDGGLRPPTPISVDPNGMPTRPTDDADDGDPISVGDEADPAPSIGVLAPPAQAPEVPPDRPPPSNIVVEPEVKVLPDIELSVPGAAGETEPPTLKQVVVAPIAGSVPDVSGLTPGDASSVAPIGIPVGATCEPGPRPSGDVTPRGMAGEMLVPPTCAWAEPQARRSAAVVAAANRVMAMPLS